MCCRSRGVGDVWGVGAVWAGLGGGQRGQLNMHCSLQAVWVGGVGGACRHLIGALKRDVEGVGRCGRGAVCGQVLGVGGVGGEHRGKGEGGGEGGEERVGGSGEVGGRGGRG